MMAAATPFTDICRKLDITMPTLRSWRREDEFNAAYEELVEKHDSLMSGELLEGELEALKIAREALHAYDKEGSPNWEIRLRASFRLLDAAGRRGKPAEKVEQTTNTTVVSRHENELAEALRDPTVRAWIEKQKAPIGTLPPFQSVPLSQEELEYEILDDGSVDTRDSSTGEGTLPVS
jgi:hypothetical protein